MVHGPHPGDAPWRGFCIITSASHLHLKARARCCPVLWAACLNFDFSSCFSIGQYIACHYKGDDSCSLWALAGTLQCSQSIKHCGFLLCTGACVHGYDLLWFFPLLDLIMNTRRIVGEALLTLRGLIVDFYDFFLRVLVHEVGVYRERLWFTVGFRQWVLFEPSTGAPLAGAMGLHAGFSVLGPSVSVLLNSWCLETTKYILGDTVMNRATHRQTDRGFRNKLALHVSHTTLFTKALGEEREEFHRKPKNWDFSGFVRSKEVWISNMLLSHAGQ